MPFTFSHPAIILPLTYLPKRWYSLTGLVIGSMTPDFEYFIRMQIKSIYSHTLEGLFWFDLPLGLLLTFIFHNIIRNALFQNLPFFLKGRVTQLLSFDWNNHFRENWLIVIISVFIGASSHLFWDGFTHLHGYFVEQIPALAESINLFEKAIPLPKVLQHLSTLIGGLAIGLAIFKLPISKTEKRINWKYWTLSILIISIIIGIRFWSGLTINQIGNLIATIISAALISATLTPLLLGSYNNQIAQK